MSARAGAGAASSWPSRRWWETLLPRVEVTEQQAKDEIGAFRRLEVRCPPFEELRGRELRKYLRRAGVVPTK
jgi:hypothetical protein